jgi:hypothetical protein
MKLTLVPALLALTLAFAALSPLRAADAPKPLKILLITGGCCHDYAKQKEILKAGLEARANVVVDQIASADKGTAPHLPAVYGNANYGNGYDLIIHDECSAGINDQAIIEGVLKPHRDGIPGVNLHCAMHSYRIGAPSAPADPATPHGQWFDYLGLQSSGHGPQAPIDLTFTINEPAITQGLENWTTIKEELYNNIQVFPSAKAVANGHQVAKRKVKDAAGVETVVEKEENFVVAWTNLYQGKTRVFSTTIGHNNETVADERYLDLVTRGVLWATGKLGDDGKAKAGFGPGGK